MPEIKIGPPLKLGRGDCPGMDDYIHPQGYAVRLGAGLQPFAYEQDCIIYEQNKDRATVQEFVTNAGIAIPVIRLIGDGAGRTGGAYLLRPQTYPRSWDYQQGIHNVFIFSPQNSLQDDWNFSREHRGQLNLELKNEFTSVLNCAVKNNKFKLMWFLNAQDGDGGGARYVEEFDFAWRRYGWYVLEQILVPMPTPNTWRVFVRLQDLNRERRRILYMSDDAHDLNHAQSVTYCGFGDEQQQLQSGLTVLVSQDMDYVVTYETAFNLFRLWQSTAEMIR